MSDNELFYQQVKDALSHLYDYTYLERHPLTLQFWPNSNQTEENHYQQLHRLLLESIEALNPPTSSSKGNPRAEYYFLLVYRYVEEWSLEDIMQELGYSRRQFFRKQQKAIELLTGQLREKLPKPTAKNTESENALDDEVDRILSRRRAINANEVIQGVLDVVRPLAKEHHITLTANFDSPLPDIYGSRTLLRQIFLNTLSQLIRQANTKEIQLQIWSKEARVVAQIITKTNPLDNKPVNPPQITTLESVQHLINKVGGNWQTFETKPEGCLCRFDFPATGLKVLLVVEDNEGVIRAFRRYLAGYNYQVIGATTGADALKLAEEKKPAIITLDVMIPNQDGWEILQALKNNPATQDIPVIICSVLEDPSLAHSLGASAYLQKPVTQTDLLAMLNSMPPSA